MFTHFPALNTPNTLLSQEDRDAIVNHLTLSLAILERTVGRPSMDEIKVKSMLSVLRSEIQKWRRLDDTAPPFFSSPSASRP